MRDIKSRAAADQASRLAARCGGASGESPYSPRGASPKMRAAGGSVSADDDVEFGDVVGGMKARQRLDRAGRRKPSTTVVNVIVSPNKAGGEEKPDAAMAVPPGPIPMPPAMPPMPPPAAGPGPMAPPGAGPAPGIAPPQVFSRGGRVKR